MPMSEYSTAANVKGIPKPSENTEKRVQPVGRNYNSLLLRVPFNSVLATWARKLS
jgi:hypothetical protein